jgi:uncharacterized protein (TIGR02996 family)
MVDRASYLRTILEYPEDDAPRMVFADWLDDRGHHERAEFIRIQCADPDGEQFRIGARTATAAIAPRQGFTDGHPVLVGEWPKTRRLVAIAMDFQDWRVFETVLKKSADRSFEIVSDNEQLFRVSRRQRLIYRGGFIHGIVLPTNVLYEHGDKLFSENPILHVEINETPLRDMHRIRGLIHALPDEVRERIESNLDRIASTDGISHGVAVRAISAECVHYWRSRAGLPSSLPRFEDAFA